MCPDHPNDRTGYARTSDGATLEQSVVSLRWPRSDLRRGHSGRTSHTVRTARPNAGSCACRQRSPKRGVVLAQSFSESTSFTNNHVGRQDLCLIPSVKVAPDNPIVLADQVKDQGIPLRIAAVTRRTGPCPVDSLEVVQKQHGISSSGRNHSRTRYATRDKAAIESRGLAA